MQHGITGRFILYVGSLYSRKIGKLLEAYKLLCARSESAPKLVLIGGRESHRLGEKEVGARLAAMHLLHRVLQLGELPQERLPVFMNAAEVFIYASVNEGFGLTPLEAMACGAPVIVSNTSALPEVAGDAALLVDPGNEQEIASAMQRVLDDSALREELRRRSIARARQFSWEKTMQETLDLYRKML
jgi:glycosyltransferase involved in cell wall biosynthesis